MADTVRITFTHLPDYAAFLLENHLDDFANAMVTESKSANPSILRFYSSLSDDALSGLLVKGAIDLLTALKDESIWEFIDQALQRWKENRLPQIERDQIVVDDIISVGRTRRRVFIRFVPSYTTDQEKMLDLIDEINAFIEFNTRASFETFINILEDRINLRTRKLEQSERLFKQAQSITHIGNYVWESSRQKLIWSDELYRIYEINPNEQPITSDLAARYSHPDDVAQLRNHIERAKATGRSFDFHFRIIMKDGRIKTLHARGEVEQNLKSGTVRIVGTAQDVTDRMRAENILVQKTMELQHTNASLREFAFVASHDLKEPLRKIATYSDRVLQTESEVSPAGLSCLQKINQGANRLQTLVDDLLSLSLISTDNQKLEFASLQQIASEAVSAMKHRIHESGAVVELKDLPEAPVLPHQFRQLFQNLIDNAIKFRRRGVGPVITISHRCLSEDEINQLNLVTSLKYLAIDVCDNGIGFDNHYAEKIFAVFKRLHGRDKYEGTGIGLAICKKIAETHGGIMRAHGIPGQGSTFSVIIPANPGDLDQ